MSKSEQEINRVKRSMFVYGHKGGAYFLTRLTYIGIIGAVQGITTEKPAAGSEKNNRYLLLCFYLM